MRTSPAPSLAVTASIILLFGMLFGCSSRPSGGSGDNDDTTPGDDDDTTQGDDDDTTPGDDDDTTPGDDDDTTQGDDDDTTQGDDDDTTQGDDDSAEGDDDDSSDSTSVRFVAMGDTGEGNTAQEEVAAVIVDVCAAQGCDFVLLTGDNFYDVGVTSATDQQWQDKFENPYANVLLPFYPSLGNHDGGDDFLGGTGINVDRGDHQVTYTSVGSSPEPWTPAGTTKWTMPARWYRYSYGGAEFFSLDTSSIFFDGLWIPLGTDFGDYVDNQENWLTAELAQTSPDQWRIAYGHHPYLSNGPHGNAGDYDGASVIPYANGDKIKDFIENHVCGKFDLYLCGHDHSRQWLTDTCQGTHLMVTGAGAKTTDIEGSNPVYWQDGDTEGFVWIEIVGKTMTVQWWNRNGTMDYEGFITKPAR